MDVPISSARFSDSQCPTYSEATGLAPGRSDFTTDGSAHDMHSDLVSSDSGRSKQDDSSTEGIAEMREVQSAVPVTVSTISRSSGLPII